MNLLFTLFFRQKWHEFKFAKIAVVSYFYVFYCGLIAIGLDGIKISVPDAFLPAIILGSCMAIALPDFLFKMFACHYATVMDAFIKTRPISRRDWNWFLVLSQIFDTRNLISPALCAPIFYFILGPSDAIIIVTILYLFSVVTGIVAMTIKKESNYADEMSSLKSEKKKLSTTSNPIFGLQYKSLWRSKRLRIQILFILVYIPLLSINPSMRDPNSGAGLAIPIIALLFGSGMIGQWGLSIEANYFNAIWTKPISIEKILTDKFNMLCISSIVTFSVIALLAFIGMITKGYLITALCVTIFNLGFSNLTILYDAYRCKPLDMFGSVFFNYQGNSNAFRLSVFASLIGSVIIVAAIHILLADNKAIANCIIAAIGIIFLLMRKRFIRSIEKRFMKDRYAYMEKYNNK